MEYQFREEMGTLPAELTSIFSALWFQWREENRTSSVGHLDLIYSMDFPGHTFSLHFGFSSQGKYAHTLKENVSDLF